MTASASSLAARAQRWLTVWLSVRAVADPERRRRAELVVLASLLRLAWGVSSTVTIPLIASHALLWWAVMPVGGIGGSVLMLLLARRAKIERAAALFGGLAFMRLLAVGWLEGPNSVHLSMVVPEIAILGCMTDTALVVAFGLSLFALLAVLAAAMRLGWHPALVPAFERPWAPFVRQVLTTGALSVVLRRGYDRAFRQVTEREQAASDAVELAQSITASLEAEVESRTAVLAGIQQQLVAFAQRLAHELTADLVHLRGKLAAFVESEQALGQSRLSDVVEAKEAVERLTIMIERLFQHAALGAAALRPAAIDMEALAREVSSQCARNQPGAIEWRIGSMPRAWADPSLMRAVLENLVMNALKFSRGRAPAVVEIGFQNEERRYFVRDNGVGFDGRLAAKLFTPFRRAHRDSEFEGDGVGLANVRRIIERSGGEVAISSEPDRGAQVVFRVPLAEESLA